MTTQQEDRHDATGFAGQVTGDSPAGLQQSNSSGGAPDLNQEQGASNVGGGDIQKKDSILGKVKQAFSTTEADGVTPKPSAS